MKLVLTELSNGRNVREEYLPENVGGSVVIKENDKSGVWKVISIDFSNVMEIGESNAC